MGNYSVEKELIESGRKLLEDKIFNQPPVSTDFENYRFLRIAAKDKLFKNINFKYTIFEHCYFRNCVFDSCNFVGCKFISTNLRGSTFTGCHFEYSSFERTIIENEVLDNSCPGYENQKLQFARTLRVNYQSLGDNESANKAISVELSATKSHLRKSWKSNEAYYRKKYRGWGRIRAWLKFMRFRILDFIWGNGESPWKLLRSVILLAVIMTIYEVAFFRNLLNLKDYWDALTIMPQVLLSIEQPDHYSDLYLSLIYFLRICAFGFFMAIVIKRFNRR